MGELQQAAEGDMGAFETLVERHRNRVMANCRYISGSPADAEDLAQEVFVKAFFGLQNFEGRAQFATWLNRIKVNHCLNFLEKAEGKHVAMITRRSQVQSDHLTSLSLRESRA